MPASTRYAEAYRGVDFRKQPARYRVGRGEQAVPIAEPYKSGLLPLWRFKTPAIARKSAAALLAAFAAYRVERDPVYRAWRGARRASERAHAPGPRARLGPARARGRSSPASGRGPGG
jgi:hypothetical protein